MGIIVITAQQPADVLFAVTRQHTFTGTRIVGHTLTNNFPHDPRAC